MQTTVTFKKIDPSDSLKDYVKKRLEKFDKMMDSPFEAHVVLSVEKIRHIAEITLTCDRLKIHAKEESESMYSSIDTLTDKVKVQIKKNKDKGKHHMSGNKKSIKDTGIDPDYIAEVFDNPVTESIIFETVDTKPMDVEDAVAQLNSSKLAFFVFNNARTEQLNVLYKHNNGKLGLIQPKG